MFEFLKKKIKPGLSEWEFEKLLLQADVAKEPAEELAKGHESPENAIKDVLSQNNPPNLIEGIKKSEDPYKILFLGPNGAGKTTTIAKLAKKLQEKGFSSVFAASDTFRAASMEQLKEHAEELGIKTIQQEYGADPAAVAFDAIKNARANNTDCVLIDTAGRQETNKDLIQQLKKITEVTEPDMKLYVDEATVGNTILSRIRKFNKEIGVDGAILTKMDLDVKGGSTISLIQEEIPVMFFGTGQGYDDLKKVDPQELTKKILEE